MKKFKSYDLISMVLVATIFLLVSCGDLSVLMSQVDDDVKLANDGYLEVELVYPSQSSWFVNPSQDIQIKFDRPVSTVNLAASLSIIDSQSIEFSISPDDMELDEVTNIITLMPKPYLADSRQYTITLNNKLVAKDRAMLRDGYSWSFTTGTYPKGYVEIHDDVGSTGLTDKYTTSTVIPIEIISTNAEDYTLSNEEPDVSTVAKKSSLLWQALTGLVDLGGGTGTNDPELSGKGGVAWDLTSSPQGPRTVYMMLRDDTNPDRNYTPLESAKTFLDTIPPTVNAGGTTARVRSAYTPHASAVDPGFQTSTGSGIDTSTVQWTAPGVSISNSTSMNASLSVAGVVDSTYTVTLSLKDAAGNADSDSFTLHWDTIPPPKPTVSGPAAPTTDITPTWTWTRSVASGDRRQYRRRLDGGTWYLDYDESYTSKGLSDGRHTLEVAQYDDPGNISTSGSKSVYVNTAGVAPYPDQPGVSYTTTFLNWPGTFLATYSYRIYEEAGKLDPLIGSGSTSTTSQSSIISLSRGKSYRWYYYVTTKSGTVTKGPYYFSTAIF